MQNLAMLLDSWEPYNSGLYFEDTDRHSLGDHLCQVLSGRSSKARVQSMQLSGTEQYLIEPLSYLKLSCIYVG